MSQVAKKNGLPVPSDYEDEEFLAKLDPVVAQLAIDVPDAKYDRKSLAQLIMQLRKFMEEVMGKSGTVKAFPKLPAKLFQDFRPDGALTVIAARLHQLKKARDIRRIEFANIGMRRQIVDMLNQVRKDLERLKLLQPPVVALHPSLGDQEGRLRALAMKLGAIVAAEPGVEGVTHIVYPFGPKGDPDDGQEYMRVLQFQGNQALVHWWYTPDSYDEAIPRHVSPQRLDPERAPAGAWKVYVRWLTDSEKFNEWMNPSDYETEEAAEEAEAAARAAGLVVDDPEAPVFQVPTAREANERQLQAAFMPPLPSKAASAAVSVPGGSQEAKPGGAQATSSGMAPAAAAAPAPSEAGGTSAQGPVSGAAQTASAPRPTVSESATQPPSAIAGAAEVAALAGAVDMPPPAQPPTVAATAPGGSGTDGPAGLSAQATLPAQGAPASAPAAATAAPPPAPGPGLLAGGFVPTVAVAVSNMYARSRTDTGPPAKKARLEVEPGSAVREGPHAVRWRSVEVHRSVTDGSANVENLSRGQLLPSLGAMPGAAPRAKLPPIPRPPARPPPSPATAAAGAATAAAAIAGPTTPWPPGPGAETASDLMTAYTTTFPDTHYIPIYAAWFRWEEVHELEEAALPDFFTGKYASRSPQHYVVWRNALVHHYRQQPCRRLTSTDARRLVSADSDCIHRIWAFLNAWGLINYQALDAQLFSLAQQLATHGTGSGLPPGPSQPSAPPAAAEGGRLGQNGRSASAVPSGVIAGAPGQVAHPDTLLTLKPVTHAEAVQAVITGNTSLPTLNARKGAAAAAARVVADATLAAARNLGPPPRIMCSAMPWVDCTAARFHCLKHPHVNLCPAAFAEGRFPPGCTPKDFVRIDQRSMAEATDDSGWSACETLLLLEALEKHGERWDDVAEHVGTKTQVQCLVHFLSLPIDDPFLDELEAGSVAGAGLGTALAPSSSAPPGNTATTAGGAATVAASGAVGAPPAASRLLPAPLGPALAIPAPPLKLSARDETQRGMDVDGAGSEILNPRALLQNLPEAGVVEAAVQRQLTPLFAEGANTVMAHAALLTHVTGATLGAEFAQAALAALSRQLLPSDEDTDMEGVDGAGPPTRPSLHTVQCTAADVRGATSLALADVAAKARAMALEEEAEMMRLVTKVVSLQAAKLDVKLKYLTELDQALEAEIVTMDAAREAALKERDARREERRNPSAGPITPPPPPPPPGAAAAAALLQPAAVDAAAPAPGTALPSAPTPPAGLPSATPPPMVTPALVTQALQGLQGHPMQAALTAQLMQALQGGGGPAAILPALASILQTTQPAQQPLHQQSGGGAAAPPPPPPPLAAQHAQQQAGAPPRLGSLPPGGGG